MAQDDSTMAKAGIQANRIPSMGLPNPNAHSNDILTDSCSVKRIELAPISLPDSRFALSRIEKPLIWPFEHQVDRLTGSKAKPAQHAGIIDNSDWEDQEKSLVERS